MAVAPLDHSPNERRIALYDGEVTGLARDAIYFSCVFNVRLWPDVSYMRESRRTVKHISNDRVPYLVTVLFPVDTVA